MKVFLSLLLTQVLSLPAWVQAARSTLSDPAHEDVVYVRNVRYNAWLSFDDDTDADSKVPDYAVQWTNDLGTDDLEKCQLELFCRVPNHRTQPTIPSWAPIQLWSPTYSKFYRLVYVGDDTHGYVSVRIYDQDKYLCLNQDLTVTHFDSNDDDACQWEFEHFVDGKQPSPGEQTMGAFLTHLLYSKLDDDVDMSANLATVRANAPKDIDDLLETSGASWNEDENYWKDLSTQVQDSYRFENLKNSSKIKFFQTTTESNEYDYGFVLLARDEYDRPWVIFPGATDEQIEYGVDGDYEDYSYVAGGTVHTNYYNEWQAIKRDVIGWVTGKDSRPNHGVVIAGHSKGGLHAIIASYELEQDGVIPASDIQLFVYGAPNAGSETTCDEIHTAVESYKRAVWYLGYTSVYCFYASTQYYEEYDWDAYDIIREKSFKINCVGTTNKMADPYEKKKWYYPRGISTGHSFYMPNLASSAFELVKIKQADLDCDGVEMLSCTGDQEILYSGYSHKTSYYLSGLQNNNDLLHG